MSSSERRPQCPLCALSSARHGPAPQFARQSLGLTHTPRARRLKDVFYMPNDNKLYLCVEYCDYDLKKYMKQHGNQPLPKEQA